MKKQIVVLLLVLIGSVSYGQKIDYNVQDGYIAEGYDVVAYFNNTAKKGNGQFKAEYNGVFLKFSNQENLDTFKTNPKKYFPQYGGWCAYAMGESGKKVKVDPETFEIREGKLYLFYNSWGTNTLKRWLKEGPKKLRAEADNNWKQIVYKK